ncbi:hypothetical protein CC1G_15711 [Coprinopsis cinerea okayama7|uniref:Uncharacterized protein n=1 Tax=Coprinopsis cinerea (strain Okayama-7 / 130 / ATCC MYA-4618 / FGSC 9003) TaxID=240176 RepID=D6RQH2_COPC7|nr:hypothetical protein CC1G_15711 [Coprinopsis cinerea okayama7\|eukprot:XP_002910282.1 hypothetical protein CC1G_15711 [Coprinopsis cinerea okayama7\
MLTQRFVAPCIHPGKSPDPKVVLLAPVYLCTISHLQLGVLESTAQTFASRRFPVDVLSPAPLAATLKLVVVSPVVEFANG